MAQIDDKTEEGFKQQESAGPACGTRTWHAPSLTTVDLSDSTLAMGSGLTDAGIFSCPFG